MNYELAQQLKLAGWPQEDDGFPCWYIASNNRHRNYYDNVSGSLLQYYKVPTLSELVEACGDGYFQLTHTNGAWQAENSYGIEKAPEITWGDTPEEAVANLYLALYNKGNETKTNKNNKPDLSDDTLVSKEI